MDLKTGLCALMGPNGCGKSNVIDAIKWALGEQSPSQIRGSRMEDIIFAGSQTTHRVGLAEVNILFDNQKNVLPIPQTQVSICRRLYRTGESEYLINNQLCRLKDITSLFADTGLVNNASMIIEQGRMDKILSKNPFDRRNPFEEAAGIGSYKEKRLECHQKILQSQNFLQQAQLSNQDLQIREQNLQRQVHQANQYSSLQNQLNSLGLQILVIKSSSLSKESALLQQQLTIFSDNLQKEQLAYSDLVEKFQQQEKQLVQENFLQEKSMQEQKNLEFDTQQSRNQLQLIEQEIHRAQQNQNSTQQSIDELLKLVQPLQKSLQESHEIQEKIISDLLSESQNLKNLQQSISQKNPHLSQLQKDWDTLKKTSSQLSLKIVQFLEKIPKNWKNFQFSILEKESFLSHIQKIDQLIQDLDSKNSENFAQYTETWQTLKQLLSRYAEFLESEFSLQAMLLEENTPYSQKQICDQDISLVLSQIQTISKEISNMQQQVEISNQKIQTLQKNLLNNQSHTSQLQQSLLENNLKTQHARNLLLEITSTISTLSQKKSQQTEIFEKHQLSLQQKLQQLKILQIQISNPKSLISKNTIQDLQKSIESLSTKKQSTHTKLQIIQHEQKLLHKSCLDNYGDSLELLESKTPTSSQLSLTDLESEFKKVKNSLEKIGKVNLLAQQELLEVQSKLGNIFTHIEDTLACIRQTSSLRKELDSLCESRFLQTFTRVQKNFQIVFNRLFGSGVANLSLIDPEKPLESGIDVSVEIPGKKIQGLHLLSGGEKTLVTVALIFSIFLVRPAPLCILDEIDAPLDRVNVDRFIHLLKEFKENTQFLLVSHNEETLAAMDYVYGITMRDGASQIFSVNLKCLA